MRAYRDVLRDEVLALSRPDDRAGLSWLPDGDASYAATLRHYTTTTKSAQEIHDIGLAQIEKLADQYRSLGPEVVGTDDLQAIFEAMRTDPKLHFESGTSSSRRPRLRCSARGTRCPTWFEVLPQARCAVQATTTGAKAFYFPPAGDGSRGGTFFVNIADPAAWGTFELESMAFHEGIPGHHLQLAIASELPRRAGVPQAHPQRGVRRGLGPPLHRTALRRQMAGIYSSAVDPDLAMFSADSMRACRLVVDTGLHALGWSRSRRSSTWSPTRPWPRASCVPEVDRLRVRLAAGRRRRT